MTFTALACDVLDAGRVTGPADCGPIEFRGSGSPLELYISVGECLPWVDYARITLYGPSFPGGFPLRGYAPPIGHMFAEPFTWRVDIASRYDLEVTTQDWDCATYGETMISTFDLWPVDPTAQPVPAAPVPVPTDPPAPVLPGQPVPVQPDLPAATPVPEAAAPATRFPAGPTTKVNSPANAYELVVGAQVAILRDLSLWWQPASGESDRVLVAGSVARIVAGPTAAEGWYWYQLTDDSMTGWVRGGTGTEENLNAVGVMAAPNNAASEPPTVSQQSKMPQDDGPVALGVRAWNDPTTRTLILAGVGAGVALTALIVLWPARRERPSNRPVIDPE